MASRFASLACAAVLTMISPVVNAQNAGLTPAQLQRALSAMQDKAVRGDAWAEGKVRELLAQIGQQFETLEPSTWRSHRSAVAAAVFLFSGGVSAPVRRVLARGYFRPADRNLLEAALSFAEGRPAMARQQLAEFDPETVDPVLSGPLALVRGSLEMESDLEQARKFFDWARLLAPGSIYEEAALRRQAIIYADMKQLDRYIRTIDIYARRYPTSPYGQKFRTEAIALLEKLADPVKESELQNIVSVLQRMPSAEAQQVLLRLANEYALRGLNKPVDMIAGVLEKSADTNVSGEARSLRALGRLASEMPIARDAKLSAYPPGSNMAHLDNLALTLERFQRAALRDEPPPHLDIRQAQSWDTASDERKALVKMTTDRLAALNELLEAE